MRGRGRAALLVTATAVLVAAAGGCGLGPGPGTSNVTVTVTRDFGSRRLGLITKASVPGSETVMRMLERSFRVRTRYGGGFVQTIDGFSGSSNRRDWFYYVNGVEAAAGAAMTAVHKGDRIWWDLHDWSATNSVPAVVGSFPEPFLHGVGGKRLPTEVECGPDVNAACRTASSALSSVGVPVANQLLGTGSGTDSVAVIVGTWSEVRGSFAGDLIAHGPGSSGVYARFTSGSLQLLDPSGHVAKTLTGDAGLVAAIAQRSTEPVWLITGTDATGVSAAARGLTQARLRDHFAVAVQGSRDFPVPLHAGT